MIVIGSQALNYWKFTRKAKDWDLVMSLADFNAWFERNEFYIEECVPVSVSKFRVKIRQKTSIIYYEIETETQESSQWLLQHSYLFNDHYLLDSLGERYLVMTPTFLLLTKRSHLTFPVHIEKNLKDYHFLKNMVGDFVWTKDEQTYFSIRFKEADTRWLNKHKVRNLNMSNDNFFNNPKVKPLQVIEHDTLHEIVKHRDTPIYEKMKYSEKMDSAWCERELFNQLPFEYKIESVLEESYVIALERFIIPENKDIYDSFLIALHKVCTTLCSGWFRDFAIEHYPYILNSYNSSFYDKYLNYKKP